MYSINRNEQISPGRIPAIKSFPTERLGKPATIIIIMLGGIIGPKLPPAGIQPSAILLS